VIDLAPDTLTLDGPDRSHPGYHGLLLKSEGSENREVAYWFTSREYWYHPERQPQLIVEYDLAAEAADEAAVR
jgi:hypothetical protein